jgi:hypothetical protein
MSWQRFFTFATLLASSIVCALTGQTNLAAVFGGAAATVVVPPHRPTNGKNENGR